MAHLKSELEQLKLLYGQGRTKLHVEHYYKTKKCFQYVNNDPELFSINFF